MLRTGTKLRHGGSGTCSTFAIYSTDRLCINLNILVRSGYLSRSKQDFWSATGARFEMPKPYLRGGGSRCSHFPRRRLLSFIVR